MKFFDMLDRVNEKDFAIGGGNAPISKKSTTKKNKKVKVVQEIEEPEEDPTGEPEEDPTGEPEEDPTGEPIDEDGKGDF